LVALNASRSVATRCHTASRGTGRLTVCSTRCWRGRTVPMPPYDVPRPRLTPLGA
jgi:hypothetical protein